jgi:hypothetical protein
MYAVETPLRKRNVTTHMLVWYSFRIKLLNTNAENISDATPDVSKTLNHYDTYFFSWFEAFS